jgi:FlaA1/EpsC-like NDP-sugar epimerase/lipopolysaccharide/colanic/teichoic acid biosynthesis glycosyltransferase
VEKMSAKRLFDISFSLIGLILFLPIFVVVAMLVKRDSDGPLFFPQKRIGKNFKPFHLYKFRTMVVNAPEKGLLITADGDLRITKVGKFLRKTKIDELPQLWNVLRGDMSIVGPRPEVEKYVNRYREDYEEILKVRPGITDISSFMYSNEEEILKDKRDSEEYYIHVLLPEKIKLAKEYVRDESLFFDLRLIFLTVFKLVYPYNTVIRIIDTLTLSRRPIVIGIQVIIFAASNYLAFLIRFDGNILPSYLDLFLKYLPLVIFARIIFLFTFSLDKGLWRYVSIKDLANIVTAVSLGSLTFLLAIRFLFGDTSYPRSVYAIDWFLNIFFLGGVRVFRRIHEVGGSKEAPSKRVIVMGAGDAAEMFLRDVEHSPFYLHKVIGLIDDDCMKRGLKIRNVPILGSRKDLMTIVEREQPDEFLIAIPAASKTQLEEIVKDLRQYGLPIKSLPSFWNLLSGRESLSLTKVLEPEDILFRAPVYEGYRGMKSYFENKRLMITGAGGSIGSELSRQIASCKPAALVLYERYEENLYKIDLELKNNQNSEVKGKVLRIHSIIGDVLDGDRLNEVMEKFQPEIILHAAAYKHVPLMEDNPYEAFKTNVLGTKMIAQKAKDFRVEKFVFISTDKAVNPINVMGMTKKIAEEIVRSLSISQPIHLPTKYITVRFGNVLESSGSVALLFKEQIKKGGPVTVTHPEVTRYFMTIPEAVSLVLQAVAMGNGGEVFVLDMGTPVKILDLAKRMIGLYGYKPGVDIDITFIGLRPGEKLHEELCNRDEIVEKTSHPKINMAISKRGVNKHILEYLENPEFFKNNFHVKEALNKLIESCQEERVF